METGETTEIVGTESGVLSEYEQQMLDYQQVSVIALGIIAGCIIAAVVMRFFHRG